MDLGSGCLPASVVSSPPSCSSFPVPSCAFRTNSWVLPCVVISKAPALFSSAPVSIPSQRCPRISRTNVFLCCPGASSPRTGRIQTILSSYRRHHRFHCREQLICPPLFIDGRHPNLLRAKSPDGAIEKRRSQPEAGRQRLDGANPAKLVARRGGALPFDEHHELAEVRHAIGRSRVQSAFHAAQ